jgi:hypothetical protein
MTVTKILSLKIINLSQLSMEIYGEKSPARLYQKINCKGRQKLLDSDLKKIANYFEKNFKINLELI